MNSILSDPWGAEPECIEPAEREIRDPVALDAGRTALKAALLLWEHRAFLIKSLLVGGIVGVLIALLIPSRYESSVQLMPPDSQSNSGLAMLAALQAKTGGAMGSLAGDVLGMKSSGSLFIGILRSRTVEDRLVARFQLKTVYRARLDEDARRELSENTGASEDRKSGIISLTVDDRQRQRARAIATAYVEELNRLVAELSTSSAHRERVFLEERLASVKQDLDKASRALAEFSSKNATMDVKDQGRAMAEAAASVQGELIAAESERRALEAVYTSSNVRVRSADAQVSELRRQLRKLGGENEEADDKNTGNPDSLYPSLRKLPLLGMKYAELYRDVKIQELVLETLTQQYEMAKVQEAREIPTVKMLDEANLPERRSFPPRAFIAILFGLMGMAAAALWIVGLEHWERVALLAPRLRNACGEFDDRSPASPRASADTIPSAGNQAPDLGPLGQT